MIRSRPLPLGRPVVLELGIDECSKGSRTFAAHECIECVETLAHDLDVLLRHRLLRRPRALRASCPLKKNAPPDALSLLPAAGDPYRLFKAHGRPRAAAAFAHGREDQISAKVAHFDDLGGEVSLDQAVPQATDSIRGRRNSGPAAAGTLPPEPSVPIHPCRFLRLNISEARWASSTFSCDIAKPALLGRLARDLDEADQPGAFGRGLLDRVKIPLKVFGGACSAWCAS